MFAHNRFQAARSPASQLQLQSTNNYARRRIQYFMCKIFADLIFCAKRHPGVQYLLANNEMSISYLHTPLFLIRSRRAKHDLQCKRPHKHQTNWKYSLFVGTQHPHLLTKRSHTTDKFFFYRPSSLLFRVYLNVTGTCEYLYV